MDNGQAHAHPALVLLRKIPKGKVATYKELAQACKTSPRAIGRILAGNKDPVYYPCYKVVASDGRLCGYSAKGGLRRKAVLLKKDGVELSGDDRIAQNKFFYKFS